MRLENKILIGKKIKIIEAKNKALIGIEGKVQELEVLLSHAKVVTKTPGKKKKDSVDIGCKVTVKNGRKQHVYHIVGEWEANPLEQKISHQSPLGKALVGKTIGEDIEIEVPAGKIKYSIIDIA